MAYALWNCWVLKDGSNRGPFLLKDGRQACITQGIRGRGLHVPVWFNIKRSDQGLCECTRKRVVKLRVIIGQCKCGGRRRRCVIGVFDWRLGYDCRVRLKLGEQPQYIRFGGLVEWCNETLYVARIFAEQELLDNRPQ